MKTTQRTLFTAALLTIFSTSVMAQDVTITYTNDLYVHVGSYKVPYVADGERDIGGFANISTLVKQGKAKGKVTSYFDVGGYLTGPYISNLAKDEVIIDIMDIMPLGAVSIGSHEFDHGWDNTFQRLSKANLPVLLNNVYRKESEKPFWNKPYTTLEKDGIRIGIVRSHSVFVFNGTVSELSLQGLDNDNNNRFDKSSTTLENQGIEVRGEMKYLQHHISELRDGADLTMALVHEDVSARQSSIGNTDVRRALDRDI